MDESSINFLDEDCIVTLSGNSPAFSGVNKIEWTLPVDKHLIIPILKIKTPFILRGRKGLSVPKHKLTFRGTTSV